MKAYIPSWEYIAGFYDGEGCFRIYPYKNTNPNGYTYTGERPFDDKYKEYKHIGRPMSVIQITEGMFFLFL